VILSASARAGVGIHSPLTSTHDVRRIRHPSCNIRHVEFKPEPKKHLPLLSGWCKGLYCQKCPRAWRFWVTGMELTARPGDNATWLHDATVDYRGKPVEKLTRARWRRVARHHALTTVPAVAASAMPWWGVAPLAGYTTLIAGIAGVWAARKVRRHARTRRLHAEWTYPAGQVVCRALGVTYRRAVARRMVELPPDWGMGDARATGRQSAIIWLPAASTWSAKSKASFTSNVSERLGIPNPRADWRLEGARPHVEVYAMPVPPETVTFDSLLPAIRSAEPHAPIVGRGVGNSIVKTNLQEDSPHVAISGPSGTGKSVLGKFLNAQRMANGAGQIMLDPKRSRANMWIEKLARDRPDLAKYYFRTEDLHNAWVAIGQECQRRTEVDDGETDFREIDINVEEINSQTKRLNRYWKGERRRIMNHAKAQLADCVDRCEGSKGDGLALAIDEGLDEADLDPPLQSPAIDAMQEAVSMGRERCIHVWAYAQRLSASVFGGNGGDIRESFQGGRFIAKWDRKVWKMLADSIPYVACPPGKRGQWGIVRDEELIIVRVPMVTDSQAMDLATSGELPEMSMFGGERLIPERPKQAAISVGVTLSDAVKGLPARADGSMVSLEALRKASQRPGFPLSIGTAGSAKLYDLAELEVFVMRL
jgi:hypothetical protein